VGVVVCEAGANLAVFSLFCCCCIVASIIACWSSGGAMIGLVSLLVWLVVFSSTNIIFSTAAAAPTASPQFAPLTLDNTAILNVSGRKDVNPFGWGDSYSVGNSCYCDSTFDHRIDKIVIVTPFGNMTVKDVCVMIGKGPGSKGRPLYNDVQCGNGPANNAGDEDTCPGRIEHGAVGCKYIGPKWNFAAIPNSAKPPTKAPIKTTTAPMQLRASAPMASTSTLAPAPSPPPPPPRFCRRLPRLFARLFRRCS
jgi:hypothetical protein